MVVLDLRFRLFFAVAPVRAAVVMVLGVAFFLAWDLAGIGRASSSAATRVC